MMKLHYKGKYDGNPDSIPRKEHKPGAVKFREPENSAELAKLATKISIVAMVLSFGLLIGRGGLEAWSLTGCILSMLTLFPHELLHASLFKEDVYLYTNLKHGMLFVVGPEDMSKIRFVVMSLLPNIVFGVIPLAAFLINPELHILGTLGAVCISMGAGDYLNVYNAITQMPPKARTYLHGFSSYWFIPGEKTNGMSE